MTTNKMKHTIICIAVVMATLLAATSCRTDRLTGSEFVEPIEVHLKYDEMGVTRRFTNPPRLSLTNNSEQFVYRYTTDEWGKITLSKLMPGEYTISVSGELTPEEVELITGKPAERSGSLGGFMGNVRLSLGNVYTLDEMELQLIASSNIIFKELYYAGSRTPTDGTYRNDIFYSIYNNSPTEQTIGDIYIAMVENYGGIGATGPLWTGEEIGNYKHVYVQSAWKITAGNDDVMMQSGQTVVIATMAAPHNKDAQFNLNSPVDLSGADYEAYINDPQNRYPDMPAPNMELAFWPDYAYLWRMGVFGQGMVLIQATREEFEAFEEVMLPEEFRDPFESEEYWLCKKVPLKYVLDAVDLIQNSTVTNSKRFPPALDSGFATVGGTYLSKSVIRKEQAKIGDLTVYQDTNNSEEDFEISTPTNP